MGLFDNLYGSGQQFGNLVDDPARQEAKRRAMLAISAQLMQAGGPSRLPVSMGQALGGALQAGQGASDEAYKSAVEAAMLRKRMEPPVAPPQGPMSVGGRLVDPKDGRVIYEPPVEVKPAEPNKTRTYNKDNLSITEEFDPTTATWKRLAVSPQFQPKTDDPSAGPKFGDVAQLRREYNDASKDFITIGDAYGKIQKAAQNPSAAGDMSLIFGFMKMLDPGSTVREGEYASARQTTGIPGQIVNAYNKALSGEILAPSQREDFIAQAGNVYKSQKDRHEKTVLPRYRDIATRWKINPDDVIGSFDAPLPMAIPPQTSRLKTATNPQTGEVLEWNGSEWVPRGK